MACSRFGSFDDGVMVERFIYLKFTETPYNPEYYGYRGRLDGILPAWPSESVIIFSLSHNECSVKPAFTR